MYRVQWIVFLILLVPLVSAQASGKKLQCVSKELKLQNCELRYEQAEYNISPTSVRIYDGTWRGVVKLPKVEKVTAWENLKLRNLGGRRILEWKVWRAEEESAPKLELESLHWVLLEIKGTTMKPRLDKIIQKRRRKSAEEGEASERFLKGTLESHLLSEEDNQIKWKAGHQQGGF